MKNACAALRDDGEHGGDDDDNGDEATVRRGRAWLALGSLELRLATPDTVNSSTLPPPF